MKKGQVYLHLGSNVGDRKKQLYLAHKFLIQFLGKIKRYSSFYETEAWGNLSLQPFLNQAILVESNLSAKDILKRTQQIEKLMGRNKKGKWEARNIDIDLIFVGTTVLRSKELNIPHHLFKERNFVLIPLLEIAKDICDPDTGLTIEKLLEACKDKSTVEKLELKPFIEEAQNKRTYLAIEGNIGAGKTTLATILAENYKGKLVLESFDDNPFLPLFYDNPKRYAFQVELFFMTERYRQLNEFTQTELFQKTIVSDYIFLKTLLFARNNLNEVEFNLFQRLFQVMNKSFPKPDLMVYLHRPVTEILKNIEKRGRNYEQSISEDYLMDIQKTYFDYFEREKSFPILVINLGDLDFVDNHENQTQLIDILEKEYKNGLTIVKM